MSLPDERDWLDVDRQCLCDILYSLKTDWFQNFINQAIQNRKSKLEKSRNLNVSIRPEFAQALQNTLNFSNKYVYKNYIASNGKAVNILKGSTLRKRTRLEREEVKDEESDFKKDR